MASAADTMACSGSADVLLGHLVGVLSTHIGDESPLVRRLCVKGLVEVLKVVKRHRGIAY